MYPRSTVTTLPTENFIIVDIETQGLEVLTDENRLVYFAVTLDNSKCLRVWHSLIELISYLDNCDSWLIFHNSKFDYRLLKQRGLQAPVRRVLDTQVLSYLCDNTRPSYSLDALTNRKLDVVQEFDRAGLLPPGTKKKEFWQIDWSEKPQAMELLIAYCKQDCKATYWLYQTLVAKIYPSGVSAYFSVVQPMLDVLIQLEQNGAAIDRSMLLRLMNEKQTLVNELQSVIAKNSGLLPKLKWNKVTSEFEPAPKTYVNGFTSDKRCTIPHYIDKDGVAITSWSGHIIGKDKLMLGDYCQLLPFNASAATGHTWWIINKSNKKLLKSAKKTAAGKTQINKDYITKIGSKLPDWFPIKELNVEIKALTMANTLLKNLQPNNHIYCDFAHTRTLTGRLATSNPNLQNIPRANDDDTEDDVNFRKLFVAPETYTYLCADLDQIELRMLAYYLAKVEKDYGLQQEFMKPESDAHQKNANTWGVTRKIAKTVIFLLTYGGQPKLMYERGLVGSLEEAETIFSNVHKGQPALARLITKVLKAGAERGYIQTIAGRRLYYKDLASRDKWTRMAAERQAFNALLQGGAGDVVHLLAHEIRPIVTKYQGLFMNIVHDEVSLAVPTVYVEQALEELNSVWERRCDILQIDKELYVPVNGTWNAGTSWADAK